MAGLTVPLCGSVSCHISVMGVTGLRIITAPCISPDTAAVSWQSAGRKGAFGIQLYSVRDVIRSDYLGTLEKNRRFRLSSG